MRATALLALLIVPLCAACSDSPVEGEPTQEDTGRPSTEPDASESDVVPDSAEPDVAVQDTTDVEAPDAADGSATADVAPDVPAAPLIEQTIVMDGAAALPTQFDGLVTSPGGPAVVYPSDHTAMPRNVAAPIFQWEGPEGSAYRLRITGEGVGIDVFTTDWKWRPSVNEWADLAREAQGQILTLQVAQLVGGGALEGPPSTLEITTSVIDGAVYYWAPSQSAIVRLPVDETAPEPFVEGSVFACAGCHALSPDGSRLAYTRGAGGPTGPMGVIGTDRNRTQIQEERLSGYYPSFAPDNIHLAVARGGNIVVLNTDTGRDVTTLEPPEGMSASHPAWSPRENTIVYAAGPSGGGLGGAFAALGVSGAGLARVTRTGEVWGDPVWLLEPGEIAGGSDNYFYPSVSPDGGWVGFNRATQAAGAGSSPPGSELWVVSINPNSPWGPVQMERAQGPDGTTNSWPKWAPSVSDGRMWLAFTSTRPYGRIATGGSQIWIASVSVNDAFLGVDPSDAAYWMPYQDPSASNHVAYWAPYRKDDDVVP